MKFVVGIERKDYLSSSSGIMEKEVEANDFLVETHTRVLYFYIGTKTVAAFSGWEYVRVKDEEA